MATDYQQLWEGAQKYVEYLNQVQARIIEVLPKYKSLLPNEFDELKEEKAQMNLLNYIRLCSIYTFADKAFQAIDELCRDLVDSENKHDQEGIDDLIQKIVALCNTLQDDIITDDITGFQRLCAKWQKLREKSIIPDWIVFKHWSFGDIVGTINNQGMCDEGLWRDATQNKDPEAVSIGTLLDSDEMIRIY
ncbi:MAG: hypothetical protein IJK43_13760 [Prevotella sp.]|nr:hypothetical protein [Prevotella sp.]